MANKPYDNITSYAKKEFRSFDELPFNELDSTIFSWLCYLMIHEEVSNTFSPKGMPLTDLLRAEYFSEMQEGIYWPDEALELLIATVCNPRFRGGRLKYYRFENNLSTSLQFSAMTISFSDKLHYIAYRGTDKSIHGWKENVMLLKTTDAPAQKMAAYYLNEVGKKLEGEIIVGGHSKGGNLAVFAAAHCDKDIQDRITRIYSHDGPGFLKRDIEYPGMRAIRDRIVKTIPSGSVVGFILENENTPVYIKSNMLGPLQHYPCSWEQDGTSFVREKSRSGLQQSVINNVNKWAESVSDEDIDLFISTLFEVIEASGVDDLGEILQHPKQYISFFAKTLMKKEPEKRALIRSVLSNAFTGKTDKEGADKNKEKTDWDEIEIALNSKNINDFGEENELFI